MYTGGATANYPTLRVQIVAVQTMKVVVILLGLITTTLQSGRKGEGVEREGRICGVIALCH